MSKVAMDRITVYIPFEKKRKLKAVLAARGMGFSDFIEDKAEQLIRSDNVKRAQEHSRKEPRRRVVG